MQRNNFIIVIILFFSYQVNSINLFKFRYLSLVGIGAAITYKAYDYGVFNEHRRSLVVLIEDYVEEYKTLIGQSAPMHGASISDYLQRRVDYYRECVKQLKEIRKKNKLVPNFVIETKFPSERENDHVWSNFISQLGVIEKDSGKAAK